MIDTNVYLSRWPFRRVHGDEPEALADLLREQGVTQAWAGSFDALLHKDLGAVNDRLANDCAAYGGGLFIPFGAVNPAVPDWEEDMRRCVEDYGMRGLRLHPNYHGYTLDDKRFAHLLTLAAEHGLLVQIAVSMEDERMMHPLVRVPHVDTMPLAALVDARPSLRVMLLNAFRATPMETVRQLAMTGRVGFETSWIEGASGVSRLLERIPAGALCFGSYAPLFYVESAVLKLKESEIGSDEHGNVRTGNALKLLG